MTSFRASKVLSALALGLIALAVACGASATPTAAPTPTPQRGPDAIEPIVATKVLEVGKQRVAFLLATSKTLVKTGSVLITPVSLGGGESARPAVTADFQEWPYGIRGAFTTSIDFDRPGRWRLDVQVDSPDASGLVKIEVDVLESSPVPAIGTVGPLSQNKTLSSVPSVEKLTTDYSPDPDLYQLSIKEAVESPLPTVVVFASPAFCTSPTCGPQVDTVTDLKNAYLNKANFIHVEIYDNPDEIQGDLDRAQISQVVNDWGMSSLPDWFNESWTFVLDADGVIRHRYEGFATFAELRNGLITVLPQT